VKYLHFKNNSSEFLSKDLIKLNDGTIYFNRKIDRIFYSGGANKHKTDITDE
jgi:hypothetical protein